MSFTILPAKLSKLCHSAVPSSIQSTFFMFFIYQNAESFLLSWDECMDVSGNDVIVPCVALQSLQLCRVQTEPHGIIESGSLLPSAPAA